MSEYITLPYSKYLSVIKKNKGHYSVHFNENPIPVGDILMDVDGFYKFWSNTERNGYWDEFILFELGNLLKEYNKQYEKEIEEYFNGQNSKDNRTMEDMDF